MRNKPCTCEGRSADPFTLYTVADTARILGFSEKTIRRMITRRELGSIRTAGSLRMTRRHLEAGEPPSTRHGGHGEEGGLMATLKRTSSKSRPWEVRWRDPRTDARPRRRFATRAAAERMLVEALGVEALSAAAPPDRQWTLQRLIDEEQATSQRTAVTAKTCRHYFAHVPRHLLDENVRHHSVETIEGILNQAASKLSLSSVQKLRSIVHSVYRYEAERNVLPRNPAEGARITAQCEPSSRAKKVFDAQVDPNEIPTCWWQSPPVLDRARRPDRAPERRSGTPVLAIRTGEVRQN